MLAAGAVHRDGTVCATAPTDRPEPRMLALAGCVPSGFIYDLPQDRYYNSGSSYYSAGTTGYYGQPYYYGQPGYYPRVVYADHDHDRDDCRHESEPGCAVRAVVGAPAAPRISAQRYAIYQMLFEELSASRY